MIDYFGTVTRQRDFCGLRWFRGYTNLKTTLVACLLLLVTVSSHGVIRDNGVDPENLGKGDWIWQMGAAQTAVGAANVQALMNFEKSKGMQWVTVKCGDQGNILGQFNANLVTAAHNAGLKIFGWAYATGDNVQGEINVALNCLALGADGFIANAQSEYQANPNNRVNATNYFSAIRAAYPNRFLAHAPFARISSFSSFPYVTFGAYCDAVMPMAYWSYHYGLTPAEMVVDLDNQWNNWHNSLVGADRAAIKPIAPIGQGFEEVTANDIITFVDGLKNSPSPASPGGYKGVSWWSAQSHTADQWEGIRLATLGEQLFPAAPTNLVATPQGNNQIVLTWADASTNETHFQIEQSAGTVLNFAPIANVTSNVTTFTVTGLTASVTYYFKVSAYNTHGDSADSNIAGATTSNGAPTLHPIADKVVNVRQNLSFPVTAVDVDPSVTNFMTDFESFNNGTSVLFQYPKYSGSTAAFIESAGTVTVATNFPPGNSAAGTRVLKASWSFLPTVSNPWARLTTFNVTAIPNPVIDLDRQLQFDVYPDKAIKVAVGCRETGNPAGTAIGSDGGTTGGVEWAGVTGQISGTPVPTRTLPSNTWTTVSFDLRREPIRNFSGGNGLLATGLGTMEHVAVVGAGGNGAYNVYMDRFAVVRINRLTYSLEPGAPAGASINATNGMFSWTPTLAQSPGSYPITVRVTDNGSPALSDLKTFQVTVNRQTNAAITALVLTEGKIQMQIPVDAGITYTLQFSTNLVAWQNVLVTNAASNAILFSDPVDPSLGQRFYRVLSE